MAAAKKKTKKAKKKIKKKSVKKAKKKVGKKKILRVSGKKAKKTRKKSVKKTVKKKVSKKAVKKAKRPSAPVKPVIPKTPESVKPAPVTPPISTEPIITPPPPLEKPATPEQAQEANWHLPREGEVLVGVVEDYLSHLEVILTTLKAPLAVGDVVSIRGYTTDLQQTVRSIQIEHQSLNQASPGQAVGIKVDEKVRKNDHIFKK